MDNDLDITKGLKAWIDCQWSRGDRRYEECMSIADRIDAEHKRQLEVLYRGMSDAEYVELPKDADDVPIHIGDRMMASAGARIDVRFLTLNDAGWMVNENGWLPNYLHHHHAPTVEDVLTEFARECLTYATCVEDHEVTDAIELYAPKLRLAGDAE